VRAPPCPLALILRAVAEEYGLTVAQLQTHCRLRRCAHPRQIAMYLARDMTDLSYPEIGHRLGGRFGPYDHSTIIYGVQCVAARMEAQPDLARELAALRVRIRELHGEQLGPNGTDGE
jgi:chromosomal replication initiator protein